MISTVMRTCFPAAAKVVADKSEEINKLNVFPVPDGDTGTNMSLTLETVVENLANLPIGAAGAEIRKAITTGALMGARGNSGVITSQILRGVAEGRGVVGVRRPDVTQAGQVEAARLPAGGHCSTIGRIARCRPRYRRADDGPAARTRTRALVCAARQAR